MNGFNKQIEGKLEVLNPEDYENPEDLKKGWRFNTQ